MLANEYIRVERETAHTHKHVHAQMSPYRYLEQWFGFPFPPPSPSPQSAFEKQGLGRAGLAGLRLGKSRVCDVIFETEDTRSVRRTPEASILTNQPGVS